MINKIITAGRIGKATGYALWAINSGAKLTAKAVRQVSDAVTDKSLYKLELFSNSGTCEKTLENQNQKQISHILESMDAFGIKQISIEKQENK